ncbi:hypothetical protein EOA24_37390 [Mesorhizobium sp. M2A.F.Ca.ET.039.01.1.1]|nr:hypothetical protein EOA24_37390 [Mesorhizobium sp. M2A.F.Ca.ET.039.01.1.1]
MAGTFAAFLSAAVPSANGQSTTELFDYPGTGLKGTVSAQPAVTLQECRLLCSSRSGCFGFDWSGAMCRLFASVDSAYDSPASTAGTRNLVPGYRPPSNPPARPVAVAPQAEPALPDAPEASGRRVSYRTIPGDPRPIAWVYINVCAGASVDATSLRRSVNDFVFEPLRLIPGQIERFDRDTTPQCASVPKAIGYAAPDADGWRIAAALKEMSPLLRPLGIGTRADGKLPAGDPDRYRIDIWLSHR